MSDAVPHAMVRCCLKAVLCGAGWLVYAAVQEHGIDHAVA